MRPFLDEDTLVMHDGDIWGIYFVHEKLSMYTLQRCTFNWYKAVRKAVNWDEVREATLLDRIVFETGHE